jgi:hypothetical protein
MARVSVRTSRRCITRVVFSAVLASPLACAGSTSGAAPEALAPAPRNDDQPRAMILSVNATPDSVVKLAKYALKAIEGVVQMPKVRPQVTTIANHQLFNRDGGGQTQVAVIAAIDRRVQSADHPTTFVELSVWVLDMPQQISASQRRAGVPVTPLTTNAPAIKHPRAMTAADTTYWRSLEYVAEAFVKHGARVVR